MPVSLGSMGLRSPRRRLQIESLEMRLPLTAQLAVDGNVAPVAAAHVAAVGDDFYFSTSNGSETQIRRFDGSTLSTVAEHRLYSKSGHAELGFLVEVSNGVMYGFTSPFFEEDIAAATFEIWHVSAGNAPQFVRELPVMSAFGTFQPPTDATAVGGNLLLRDASSRYQLINPTGSTIATWSAPIEGNCGNPIYSPVHADGSGVTIEAAYNCSSFLSPLFAHTDGRQLSEVELHPSSLYLPNGTQVTSVFTRESQADELTFETIAGRESVKVDGKLVKSEALTRFGEDLVFFAGDDGTSGREPWITDGTVQGTRMLHNVSASGSSDPQVVGQTPQGLLFSAFSEARGVELWITDGTPQGTSLLRDIVPGPASSNPINVMASLESTDQPLNVQLDNVFFWVQGTGGNRELWATDGTMAGTERITDIVMSATAEVTAVSHLIDGTTALGFSDVEDDLLAWISDGTAQGTKKIDSLPAVGRIEEFATSRANSHVVAIRLASNEIWSIHRRTDQSVRFWSEAISYQTTGFHPKNISALGDRVLFTTDEGAKSRVWIWDPASTQLFSPGIIAIGSKMTIRVLSPDTAIFTEFNIVRVLHHEKLAALGTQLLRQHEAAGGHSYLLSSSNKLTIVDADLQQTRPAEAILHLTVNDDALFALNEVGAIVRYDGKVSLPLSGPLFESNAKLYPRSSGSLWVVEEDKIHRFDIATGRIGRTWFAGEVVEDVVVNEAGRLFWRSVSGRSLKTITGNQIIDLMSTRDIVEIEETTVVGNRIFFVGVNPRQKRSLWTSNGTEFGSRRLALIPGLENLTTDGQKLYFTGEHSIWESDGTIVGTRPASMIQSEQINATADRLQVIGKDLYFSASDGRHGKELFFTSLAGNRFKPGDVDRDGKVNFTDFLILSNHFGASAEQMPNADFNDDGQIGFTDFLLFSSNFDS